jgi:FtsP/CotA-like multicopper oxidase with cupredoxin domain
VLKEFGPTFSRGGDMAMNFLAGSEIKELKDKGETAMNASIKAGNPKGYEVGYQFFTINGHMLGHGEPIRVKRGQRVLLHILNGSAGEIRSLAMSGHRFRVVALDGNPVPHPVEVPVLWIGTAERISAVVEMNHPGVFALGDLADDDRGHGMGVVVEYAGAHGKPVWQKPPAYKWDYTVFGTSAKAAEPDHVVDMVFAKQNAADGGFNRWTINGAAYPDMMQMVEPMLRLTKGARYRFRMRNESDDIHPTHLHRRSFELTRIGGKQTSGVIKAECRSADVRLALSAVPLPVGSRSHLQAGDAVTLALERLPSLLALEVAPSPCRPTCGPGRDPRSGPDNEPR